MPCWRSAGWRRSYRKISPKNKFVVASFHFNCNPVRGSNPPSANDFQAVLNLQNIAEFPVSYRVETIEFRIQNTVGNNQFQNRGTVVDAQQTTSFSSDVVSFHQPIPLPTTGVLKATIAYGRLGKEKFNRPISLMVHFSPDSSVSSGVRYSWNNI
jgi:hypothetical protein